MKVYGVDLAEGSHITNPVLPSGPAFPAAPDMAELFFKTSGSPGVFVYDGAQWISIGGSSPGAAKGSNGDEIFFENDQIVTSDYTITASRNAISAGPLTIDNNVTVTIPSGVTWTIVGG